MKIIISKRLSLSKCYFNFSSTSNNWEVLRDASCFTVEHLVVFKTSSQFSKQDFEISGLYGDIFLKGITSAQHLD